MKEMQVFQDFEGNYFEAFFPCAEACYKRIDRELSDIKDRLECAFTYRTPAQQQAMLNASFHALVRLRAVLQRFEVNMDAVHRYNKHRCGVGSGIITTGDSSSVIKNIDKNQQ